MALDNSDFKRNTVSRSLICLTRSMWLVIFLVTFATANPLAPRIIGGTSTSIEKHPYQVSIHFVGMFICGGSIISSDWVLTAAHCVYGRRPSGFQIRTSSTYNKQDGTVITGIQRIIFHEFYDDDTFDYDVAIIKMPIPITLNAKTKAVPLAPSNSAVPVGSAAVVTGWGYTSVSGSASSNLQSLTAPVVDQNTCRKIFTPQHKEVTKTMLCAGSLKGGQGSCQGDSGGPLVLNGVQIGVVSWGAIECAKQGYPGVYTRVSEVRSWIDAKQRREK